jgi:uncharacterized coiled-coil protein SlyX
MDEDTLDQRLAAVERALTDEEATPSRPDLEGRLTDIEERLRDLEAATQALRGYVGDVRYREDRAERHGDAQLAEVKRRSPEGFETTHEEPRPPRRSPVGAQPEAETDGGVLDRLAAWL